MCNLPGLSHLSNRDLWLEILHEYVTMMYMHSLFILLQIFNSYIASHIPFHSLSNHIITNTTILTSYLFNLFLSSRCIDIV